MGMIPIAVTIAIVALAALLGANEAFAVITVRSSRRARR
jgi:hypothetical protein